MSSNEKVNIIDVSVVANVDKTVGGFKEMKPQDITIPSDESYYVSKCGNDKSKRVFCINVKDNMKKPVRIEHEKYAMDQSGEIMCILNGNSLYVYNTKVITLVAHIPLSPKNKCFYLKFISSTAIAAVLSDGLYLITFTPEVKLECITNFEKSVRPERILDVYVDVECSFYMLQVDDDDIGFIQTGSFNGKSCITSGIAGCLCTLETKLISMHCAVLFRRSKSDPEVYSFCVTDLNSEIILGNQNHIKLLNIDHESRPEKIFVDSSTGLAIITFRNGFIHIWDTLTGERISKEKIADSSVIVGRSQADGGFLTLWSQSPEILRLTLNYENLIEFCYEHARSQLNVIHLLFRLPLHVHCSATLDALVNAYFLCNDDAISNALTTFCCNINLQDELGVMSIMQEPNAIEELAGRLFDCWLNNHDANLDEECVSFIMSLDESQPDYMGDSAPEEEEETQSKDSQVIFSEKIVAIKNCLDLLPNQRSRHDVCEYLLSEMFVSEVERFSARTILDACF